MAIPTISGIVASNDANGAVQAVVTFSVAVSIADLTGISISGGSVYAVSVNALTLVFLVSGLKDGEVETMTFLASNTITADVGGESLALTEGESITNNVVNAINSVLQSAGAMQDAAEVHTAVKVLDDVAKVACKAAC